MSNLFEQMIAAYSPKTHEEERNATYEVIQKVTLAGLWRGGLFNRAAFYGGTCLRIFHQLPRFSEDMDFSLLSNGGVDRNITYFGVHLVYKPKTTN